MGEGCERLTIFMQSRVPLGPGKCHVVVLVNLTKAKHRNNELFAYCFRYCLAHWHLSKDLSWSQHISTIVNKANQVLGLITQTVGTANTRTFSLLYNSLVRPLLEYAVPVWNPYLVKDIHAIENVQRRTSRLDLRQKRGDMPYVERRTYFSLVEC